MPSIGRIQSTNFQALLDSLGITRNNIPFDLRSEVSPVVLVGGTVSFIAPATPPYGVTDIFTAGEVVAPVINSVLADTGPLPVGAYTVKFIASVGETNILDFSWRDVPNTADLWEQNIRVSNLELTTFDVRLDVLNAGERFRVTNRTAGAATIVYQVSILARI